MRSDAQKERIVSNFSPPIELLNVLTQDELRDLASMFDNAPNKIHKNTGPVTLDLTASMLAHPAIEKVLASVREEVGDFNFLSGFFFQVTSPHIIHNDDSFELPNTFKGINIPLRVTRTHGDDYPELCFFDQYYLDGPAKFMHGSHNVPAYYNEIVYDYDRVCGLTSDPFPEHVRERVMGHLRPSNLTGLSYCTSLESRPGKVLVFDAVRLHVASDFRKLGITSKLGISIFTTK